jgi:hypothetical protein
MNYGAFIPRKISAFKRIPEFRFAQNKALLKPLAQVHCMHLLWKEIFQIKGD